MTNVPLWKYATENYPVTSVWTDPAKVSPPENVSSHQSHENYQGFRGFLKSKLPGFTWLGENTQGHGPYHNGYPRAKISSLYAKFDKNHLNMNPSFTIVIFFAGMNNCNRPEHNPENNAASEADWEAKLEDISARRVGKGRTAILAVKLPLTKANNYFRYNFGNLNLNITSFNSAIDAYESEKRDFIDVIKVQSGLNIHPSPIYNSLPDDGMHFDFNGYRQMSNWIFAAIMEALQ
jgi:hypothetical protein